jgi:zinc protease
VSIPRIITLVLPKPRHYTELKFPALREIPIPSSDRYQLSNGLTIFLIEDHELPLVQGTLLFSSGSRLEPLTQVGLAELTGELMRTGGTQAHSSTELNRILEQRAASVESGIATEVGYINFETLSPDLEDIFPLVAEVLRQPVFESKQVDLAKVQMEGSIARQNDDPNGIANREWLKLVYGSESPYARTPTHQTLARINRSDLVNFYQDTVQPKGSVLGIVGDFDPDRLKPLISSQFDDWGKEPNRAESNPQLMKQVTPPTRQQPQSGGFFLIDQEQLTQTTVLVGHLGGQVKDPDYAALKVMEGILNGFGGRLFQEIRSRQGLAYSVYASWRAALDHPGVWVMGGQTRSETTVPFIQSLLREMERIRTEAITPEELAYAKDTVLNAFVFNFQDPAQTLSRLLRYHYFGYPSETLFQFRQQVEAVTIRDIQRVAQAHLHPDRLITLIVGQEAAINPPLSSLSQAKVITRLALDGSGS